MATKASLLSDIQKLLREAGLRSTSARIAVLQQLRKAGRPQSHAEVATAVANLGLDKATVFRNLNDLTEAGLLSRSELGDHVWRFEIRSEKHSHGAAHPHFLCLDCGSVTCLPGSSVTTALKTSAESIGEITEILVRGHCHNCAG
ncbi:MAG: Fur family transcriptional regulator [Planctomycetaceae bacterium]|jgi:Fur family ferric uptake transcriptional regulator